MRAIVSLLSAALLFGAAAATAQSFPCASVAPEVREQVRQAGACSDAAPSDAAPASSAVTVRLPDGTVARVPREIASTLEGARTPTAGKTEAQAKVSAEAGPAAPPSAAPPSPKPEVDGSNADAASSAPIAAPPAAAAPLPTPAPAADSAPAAAAAAAPAPTASAPTVPPGPGARLPIAFPANAALLLVAGVLVGLLFGVLLTRQWLLRRAPAADVNPVSPVLFQQQFPIETEAGGVPETSAAPEVGFGTVRFAARREPGETTIVMAPRPAGAEGMVEQSSQHA